MGCAELGRAPELYFYQVWSDTADWSHGLRRALAEASLADSLPRICRTVPRRSRRPLVRLRVSRKMTIACTVMLLLITAVACGPAERQAPLSMASRGRIPGLALALAVGALRSSRDRVTSCAARRAWQDQTRSGTTLLSRAGLAYYGTRFRRHAQGCSQEYLTARREEPLFSRVANGVVYGGAYTLHRLISKKVHWVPALGAAVATGSAATVAKNRFMHGHL